jgi:two-component system sensor histidine kinase KdpD
MKPLHIREARWGEVWKAALVWALAAGAMVALDDQVDLANLAMLLLLASALAGLWLRAWVAMGASAAAVLAFNWAFVRRATRCRWTCGAMRCCWR